MCLRDSTFLEDMGCKKLRKCRSGPGDGMLGIFVWNPCSPLIFMASLEKQPLLHLRSFGLSKLSTSFDYCQKVSLQIIVRRIWLRRSICPLCELFEDSFGGSIQVPNTNMCQHPTMLAQFSLNPLPWSCTDQSQWSLLHHCEKLCFEVSNQNG